MGFLRRISGKTAADAATESAQVQVDYGDKASALLDPFKQIGEQGLNLSGFLTDPSQQMDFLQNNPLFQASLDNANGVTSRMAAAGGRLSSGDTLQSLSNNFLTSAMPLISDQKNSIGNLLNFGQATAANQGNLLTGQGAALAGGIVGAENARADGYNNLFNLAGQIMAHGKSAVTAAGGGAFSDKRLKANIKKIGEQNGHNIYSWLWNSKAADLGLKGKAKGVIAQEVKHTHPDAIVEHQGYLTVDYSMIGVAL